MSLLHFPSFPVFDPEHLTEHDIIEIATFKQKYCEWKLEHERRLLSLLAEAPKYTQLDDVGGMYPYEVQMWGADVEKWIQRLRNQLLGAEEKKKRLLEPNK